MENQTGVILIDPLPRENAIGKKFKTAGFSLSNSSQSS